MMKRSAADSCSSSRTSPTVTISRTRTTISFGYPRLRTERYSRSV
jgi:hypothetical protein